MLSCLAIKQVTKWEIWWQKNRSDSTKILSFSQKHSNKDLIISERKKTGMMLSCGVWLIYRDEEVSFPFTALLSNLTLIEDWGQEPFSSVRKHHGFAEGSIPVVTISALATSALNWAHIARVERNANQNEDGSLPLSHPKALSLSNANSRRHDSNRLYMQSHPPSSLWKVLIGRTRGWSGGTNFSFRYKNNTKKNMICLVS